MRTVSISAAAFAALALGCASHPAPTDQVASSLASVRGAEEAGALQVPEAALHVKLAQEQINQAQALMADDENQRAEDLAVRAYQDAELAVALAREEAAKRRLQQFARANPSSGGEQTEAAAPSGGSTTIIPPAAQPSAPAEPAGAAQPRGK